MKIPVLGAPQVQDKPRPTPYSNLNFDTGSGAVRQGLQELGAGVGEVAEKVQAVKARANAVAVNDLLTAYQVDNITALDGDGKNRPGFLSTKGRDASAFRAELLKGLEERGGKLEESLQNDEQKKLFRQHAQKIYLGSRARVEGHVMQQNEAAEVGSLQGRMQTGLSAIANNYADVAGTATQTQNDVEQMLRAFHHGTPELGEAKVQAFRQEATAARMDGYLAQADWKGAETLFEKQKAALGTKADNYAKTIRVLKDDALAQANVDTIIANSRDQASGKVDEVAAEKNLQLVEGHLRDETQKRLEHALGREARAWTQNIDTHFTRAFGAYLSADGDLGAIDSQDKAWLLTYAPSKWNAILHEEYAGDARARAAARRARGAGTKETEEQRRALIEFKADVVDNRDKYDKMTPEGFFSEWRERLSSKGFEKAGDLFAHAKKDAKPNSGHSEFSDFVKDEVRGTPALRDKRQADQFRALMGDQFRAFQDAHPDRKPTLEELGKMRDGVWTTKETWFGLGSPKAVLRPRAQPGAASTPVERTAVPPGTTLEPKAAPKKVEIVAPNGKVGKADEAGLEDWLKRHPTWRRK